MVSGTKSEGWNYYQDTAEQFPPNISVTFVYALKDLREENMKDEIEKYI